MKDFEDEFRDYFRKFEEVLATDAGDWTVKGFIDVFKNIYAISVDTKVVSKIIELMMIPIIADFAAKNGFSLVLSEHQNHYPDVSFVKDNQPVIAMDLKSTYRTSETRVNGFTLGAFTGYFRQRESNKNVTYPYGQYSAHYVLGVIYSRTEEELDERTTYAFDDLHNIVSVAKDFSFLLRQKWEIAGDKPGSGNTKNIGSIKSIEDLVNGRGPFANLGEHSFDDYWMNYLTTDMAQAIESSAPFTNREEYLEWKKR